MGKRSREISDEIIDLETKIVGLEERVRVLRAQSDKTETERRDHAFAALVEGDESSQKKMQKLAGGAQQLESEARNIEAAICTGVKKLLDLRAAYASAILTEKIQEVRSIVKEAKLSEDKLRSLATPFLDEVAKAMEAELRLVSALRELGQIVKPSNIRSDFEAPLSIELRLHDFGHPSITLASHILGEGGHLDGVEIGLRDSSMLTYRLSKLDGIEQELDKLQPVSKESRAAWASTGS